MKRLLTVSVISVLIMTACTVKPTVTNDAPLRIHVPKVRLVLDPHRMEDMYSMAVVLQIFRGLFRYDPHGEVLPDLAEKWVVSDNSRTYTIKLRSATFSNGDRILASHVVNSLARVFFLGAGIGADLEYISGSKKFKQTKNIDDLGIKALGQGQVVFELEHPSALFLKHLSVVDCAILPLKRFDEKFVVNATTPFSGPYRVASMEDSFVLLQKWRSDALDSKKPPSRIEIFQSDRAASDLAQSGATDSLDFEVLPEVVFNSLLSKGWKQSVTELVKSWFVIMNPRQVPKEVRAHLYRRVNQAEFAAQLKIAQVSPAYGLIPNGMPGALVEPPFLGEAKRVRTTIEGNFRLQYQRDNPLASMAAAFLKSAWESKDLKINLTPLTKAEYLKKMFAGEGELIIGAKGIDYYDGYSELTYFRSGYEANYFHVDNPSIDNQLNEVVRTLSSDARAERYKFIQKAILQEYTVIPLLFGSQGSGLWSNRVKLIPAHPIGLHGLPLETLEMK